MMKPLFAARIHVATVLLLMAGSAVAQPSDEEDLALAYGDKDSVSIATGSQQSVRRAPAVVSVITADDIQAMGATDLDQVLETVPGVHVSRTAGGYSPIYIVNGIFSEYGTQTLMLQNGVPMTTLFLGDPGGNIWGGLSLENVARIEVLRSPGSALYGADAYAGVINIITKTATEIDGTQVGARAGSFNSWDAWAQHGGKMGPFEVAAHVHVGSTDGFKSIVTQDAQSFNDTIFGTHASLAPGPVNTGYEALDANVDIGYDKWRLRAGYKLRDDLGAGAGIASALDPVGKLKSERINSDLSWNDPLFSKNWGVGAVASYMQYNQLIPVGLRVFPPGFTLPTGTFPIGMIGAPETWEWQMRLSAFATYTGFSGHNIRVGAGHDNLDLYKTRELKNFSFTASGIPVPLPAVIDYTNIAPFLTPHERKIDYVYAQDEWNFARDWALTAGVRQDRYSDFGKTTNPRLALVWDAALNFTAKLLYGTAFRAPSFNEEFSVNNPVAVGNPSLRPETIKTTDAVLSWQARSNLQLNFSLFEYRMQDLIALVPNVAPAQGSTFFNTGSQNGRGLELEGVWSVDRDLQLSGNYTHQRSTDQASGQDAGYAPHNHLNARAVWRFADGWFATPQVNWVADRARAPGDARSPVPDYTTVDLTLGSNRGKDRWDFSASIRNLFNATVLEPSLAPGSIPFDLPMAPRAFYVQAVYRL